MSSARGSALFSLLGTAQVSLACMTIIPDDSARVWLVLSRLLTTHHHRQLALVIIQEAGQYPNKENRGVQRRLFP